MFKLIIGIFLVLIVIAGWLLTSVYRGARRRDKRVFELMAPILKKLDAEEEVTIDEARELAQRLEVRHLLFFALRQLDRPDLIPPDFNSGIEQAKSSLVYWMMHPNELGDPPEKIEFVETITRPFQGIDSEFHVFRYKMADSHWAGGNDWILGFAGPLDPDVEPYTFRPPAFSRVNDLEGKVTPAEIVDWYIDMMKQKGYGDIQQKKED